MERSRFTTLSVAYVLVFATVAGVPLALGPGSVAADNHTSDAPYSIAQNGECTPLWPRGDGSTTGPTYYDYRNRSEDPSAEYSSYGTTDLQAQGVSQLYVYAGSDGDSLVVLHDALGEDDNGGAVSFNVSGLPADGTWSVEDDNYPNQDDVFEHGETTSEMHWMWSGGRTDGGMFRGLGEDGWDEITIDPAFADESWAATERPNSPWPYASEGPTEWIVRDGTGETRQLSMTDPVTIQRGTCGGSPPAAALDVPANATPGSTVTLNATASTDPDDDVVEYRWDFDDGSEVTTTEEATTSHAYDGSGTYEPSVTVVDDAGNADTATATITVEAENEAPTAALSVPDTATVNESVTLDASGSTDDEAIEEYRWAVDGTAVDTTDEPTTSHAFTASGDHEVTVTVVDADNATDAASATITIEEPDETAPTAAFSVNDTSPTVGQSIAVDASASSDDSGIANYSWTFGDGNGDSGATATHAYGETGNYTITLTVTDGAGNADTANATVQVGPATSPTASLDAPGTVERNASFELDATGSTDPDGEIVEYRWDLDDDGSVDRTNTTGRVTHEFGRAGDHTVTVTVVDNDSNVASTSAVVHVVDDTPPDAALSVPANATAGEDVAFDASGSTDDLGIVEYRWDFDDGTTETTNDSGTSHAYADAGTYVPTVTALDAEGNRGTANATITVAPAENETGPSAEFTVNDTTPAVGQHVAMEATGSVDDPANTSYAWDFGDGETGNGFAVTHVYDAAGDYTASLTVSVAGDGQTTSTRAVVVTDPNGTDGGDGSDGGGDGGGSGGSSGGSSGGGSSGASSGGGGGGGSSSGGGGAPPSDPVEPGRIVAQNGTVAPDQVAVGESASVEVVVENPGEDDATDTVDFSVDGEVVDRREVTLAGGESTTIAFTTVLSAAGEHTLRVDDWTIAVVVEPAQPDLSVVDVRLGNATVSAGQGAAVLVTVANDGSAAGQYAVDLRVFEEVVDRETVNVPPGERRTVRFVQRFDSPGTYDVSVAGQTKRVEVTGDASTSVFTMETPSEVNRFGALGYIGVGGLMLAGAAIFASRRL